jgi:hypothetical protein
MQINVTQESLTHSALYCTRCNDNNSMDSSAGVGILCFSFPGLLDGLFGSTFGHNFEISHL